MAPHFSSQMSCRPWPWQHSWGMLGFLTFASIASGAAPYHWPQPCAGACL